MSLPTVSVVPVVCSSAPAPAATTTCPASTESAASARSDSIRADRCSPACSIATELLSASPDSIAGLSPRAIPSAALPPGRAVAPESDQDQRSHFFKDLVGLIGDPPSYQPGADHISKCRWQPVARPVSLS